jgi:hypothetical protein
MMRTLAKFPAAALALLLAVAPTAWAGTVYKWVDQQGAVHYGSNPPPGQPTQTVQPPPPPPTGSAEESAQLKKAAEQVDKSMGAQTKAQQKAEKEAARKKTMAENCRKARSQLEMLQNRNRIQVVSGGKVHTMTTEERASTTKKIQDYLDKYCKDN